MTLAKKLIPDPPGPGQESVWDYPRPPILRACHQRVQVMFGGRPVADTLGAWCVLETSHPPSYYLPPDDVESTLLIPAAGSGSFCEFKGVARFFDVRVDERVAGRAAWSYPAPGNGFEAIAEHLCFYAGMMDACYVGDERVVPQPGGFYGGWITSNLAGPFKGGPGTLGW